MFKHDFVCTIVSLIACFRFCVSFFFFFSTFFFSCLRFRARLTSCHDEQIYVRSFFLLVFIQGSDWWWGGCLTFIRYMKVLNVYALVRVTPILHIQWLMLMGKLLHAQVLLFSSLCHENWFITIFSFTAFYWCIIDHAVILLYVNWNHGL